MKRILLSIGVIISIISCTNKTTHSNSIENSTRSGFSIDKNLEYCYQQTLRTLDEIGDTTMIPRNIMKGEHHWNLKDITISEWTLGFWPGILWYVYESLKDEKIKKSAIHYTDLLQPLTILPAYDHDLGFQIFCSYGNAYSVEADPHSGGC